MDNNLLPDATNDLVCPYLGLVDDSSTSIGFASLSNYCHRARPIAPAIFEHQRSYCLVENHVSCPIFKQAGDLSMPLELRAHVSRPSHHRLKYGTLGLYIFLIALIGSILFISSVPAQSFSIFGIKTLTGTPTLNGPTPVSKTEILAGPTPKSAFSTATVVPSPTPSLTRTPTVTVTPRPVLRLEVKLGLGSQFLIHKVRRGESLELFERKYDTTIEAINAVNVKIPSPLVVNAIVVIPVGIIEPKDLPRFDTYLVSGSKIRLDQLAQKLSVDPKDLAYYNALEPATFLMVGDWLLVPHPKPTFTPTIIFTPTVTFTLTLAP
jgi:hypothetical protein